MRLEQIAMDALAKVREYQGFAQIPEQLKAFQADPVWSLFGMDNENFLKLRYIGNYYTAIFRKMGDMYEGFVRCIMADTLGLDEEAMSLPYSIEIDGEAQGRTLDAQVVLSDLQPRDASRIRNLLTQRVPTFQGNRVGFEVRCCYQIGDSKRIQADATTATYLRKNDCLPVLMIFCTTSLTSPVKRLRRDWLVTEGMDSYTLLQQISGFDLYGYLSKMKPQLTAELQKIVKLFQLPTLE